MKKAHFSNIDQLIISASPNRFVSNSRHEDFEQRTGDRPSLPDLGAESLNLDCRGLVGGHCHGNAVVIQDLDRLA